MKLLVTFLCLQFLNLGCSKSNVSSADTSRNEIFSRIEMNDVAFLMPLPTTANPDVLRELLGLETRGAYGDLMPAWLWDKMPVLRTGMLRQEVKQELRLVGVRFDPCFREGVNVENVACQAQIRLVMQPIFFDSEKKVVSTRDTAVHLFYKIEFNALRKLISDLRLLGFEQRALFENAPVDVYPLFAKLGYASPTYHKFVTLLLAHLGEQKIIRTTFMTVAGLDVQWTFGGFDILGERVNFDIVIPGTFSRIRQTLTSDTSYPVQMFSSIVSAGTGPDNLSMFGAGSELLKQPVAAQELAIRSLHRVENPLRHNPGSVDCISCHLTTMARAWSEEKGLPRVSQSDESYIGKNNMSNTSQADPRANVLRAFGYFHEKTAISLRTLHEIDSTVDFLNHDLR